MAWHWSIHPFIHPSIHPSIPHPHICCSKIVEWCVDLQVILWCQITINLVWHGYSGVCHRNCLMLSRMLCDWLRLALKTIGCSRSWDNWDELWRQSVIQGDFFVIGHKSIELSTLLPVFGNSAFVFTWWGACVPGGSPLSLGCDFISFLAMIDFSHMARIMHTYSWTARECPVCDFVNIVWIQYVILCIILLWFVGT